MIPYTPDGGDTSLIARFLFEQDLTDSVGNYHGTAEGAISYNSDSYEGGYSLDVGGNDEGSNLGTVNFGTSGFSISFRHKYANTTNTAADVLFANRNSNSGDDGFGFWLNSWATTDGVIRVYTGDGTNQDGAASTYGAYNSGVWNHIVVVYDGSGGWTIYVDGVDVTADSSTQDDFATSGNITMIGNWSSLNYSAPGLYDDLRIFNKALTPIEVSNIFSE